MAFTGFTTAQGPWPQTTAAGLQMVSISLYAANYADLLDQCLSTQDDSLLRSLLTKLFSLLQGSLESQLGGLRWRAAGTDVRGHERVAHQEAGITMHLLICNFFDTYFWPLTFYGL